MMKEILRNRYQCNILYLYVVAKNGTSLWHLMPMSNSVVIVSLKGAIKLKKPQLYSPQHLSVDAVKYIKVNSTPAIPAFKCQNEKWELSY